MLSVMHTTCWGSRGISKFGQWDFSDATAWLSSVWLSMARPKWDEPSWAIPKWAGLSSAQLAQANFHQQNKLKILGDNNIL